MINYRAEANRLAGSKNMNEEDFRREIQSSLENAYHAGINEFWEKKAINEQNDSEAKKG